MEKTLRFITDKTAALIITHENRRYLTGFPSSLGYLFMSKEGNKLFVDGRYYEAAQGKAVDCKVVLMENLTEQLNNEIIKLGTEKIIIETENTLTVFDFLKKRLNCKVSASKPLSDKLKTLRSVKKRDEVASVVAAQRIAEKAFSDVLDFIKVGKTEREIAAFLEYRMKLYGAEKTAF